jgi:trans-aconitate 2-methyltransferase
VSDAWEPGQYDRFAAERRQPFRDLLRLVEARSAPRVVDLGCGTGSTTRELHQSLAARETLGIERSPAMLVEAARHVAPGLSFRQGDLEAFADESAWDVVFSNAALHWVPDHPTLFARLVRAVRPGGQLAVQVPANHDQRPRRLAEEISLEEPFRTALSGFTPPVHVLSAVAYARLLHELGLRDVHVRLQVYGHLLASRDDVLEWVKGTTLTVWRERLGEALYATFLERYAERLRDALPDERPFFFPFQRILMRGTRR